MDIGALQMPKLNMVQNRSMDKSQIDSASANMQNPFAAMGGNMNNAANRLQTEASLGPNSYMPGGIGGGNPMQQVQRPVSIQNVLNGLA